MEYRLETNNLASQIKYLSALKGLTVTKLKEIVNEKFGKSDSNQNLSNKLRTKTFRVSELEEIMSVLGYDIILREK